MGRIACLVIYLFNYFDVRSGSDEEREYKRCRLGMWFGLFLAITLWFVAISYLPAWGNPLDAATFGERTASVVFAGLAFAFSVLSLWSAWRLWREEVLRHSGRD
ncbi:hypothetical protein DK842_18155 [Chromobacterium phragmitis]|uniref:hypothetical protein n=1 Tax=Chromobacterium phragmitis TaxID=2202141 RepID=UPI000DECD740|nr:hypothetical protein [Chromobacterium phragmitis]AXE31653.1 hypothetical protein DK842_18155 [Chromobacterium phragmitis]